MEVFKKKVDFRENDIIFSQAIKAGKRIYYLDVKKNRKNELFLTITESRKLSSDEENAPIQYEKHKIFLYKEDFDKFIRGLNDALEYIKKNNIVDFVPQKNEILETEDNGIVIGEKIDLKIDF